MLKKTALVVLSAVLLSGTVHAQINEGQLAAASAYDVGVLQSGGLDSALWQGVPAQRATALLENIDRGAMGATGSGRNLIRAAILSGGVPPQATDSAEREAYIKARLSAVLGLSDLAAFDTLVEQSSINPTNPVFTKTLTERALLGGDTKRACAFTDTNTAARNSPYWAKMRAFCHVLRDETPAAELTVDLLTRTGHKDDSFFNLLTMLMSPKSGKKKTELAPDSVKTPLGAATARVLYEQQKIASTNLPPILSAAIALDNNQEPDVRLAALLASAHMMTAEQIRSALGGLTSEPLTNTEVLATKIWDAKIWGIAYLALRASNDMNGSTALAGALLAQADKHGQLLAIGRALEAETGFIPADFQAKSNAEIFARIAVLRGDTGALRGLFQALEADDPLRGRIALASDALGNGFMLGALGTDIETRLAGDAKTKSRAVRDSFIAVAMGANLSDSAEQILRDSKQKGRRLNPGALLALQAAARRGSKAETALRAAEIIEGKPLRPDALAALITAMTSAGLHEQAGRLAALDIIGAK